MITSESSDISRESYLDFPLPRAAITESDITNIKNHLEHITDTQEITGQTAEQGEDSLYYEASSMATLNAFSQVSTPPTMVSSPLPPHVKVQDTDIEQSSIGCHRTLEIIQSPGFPAVGYASLQKTCGGVDPTLRG